MKSFRKFIELKASKLMPVESRSSDQSMKQEDQRSLVVDSFILENNDDIESLLSSFNPIVKRGPKSESYTLYVDNRLSARNEVELILKKNNIKYTIKPSSKSSFNPIFIDGTSIIIIFKPNKSGSDAKSTAMQERTSAWIFRRVLNDNKKYKTPQDIFDDPLFKKEVLSKDGIYPSVTDEWIKGFFAQQKKMLDEFSDAKFTEFNRDGGFMDYITKLVSSMGVRRKDTWNPADIWLVQDQDKVIKEIEDALGKVRLIPELNAIMRRLYKERRLVGISLKKITGKEARYEEINVNEIFGLDENYAFNLDWKNSRLSLSTDHSGKFSTQDLTIIARSKKASVKFQIKQNDSNKRSNLKFEPTQKGAGAARLGKVPLDMLSALLSEYNIKFVNKHNFYPSTLNEFEKVALSYKTKIRKILRLLDTGGVNDADSAIENIRRAFGNKDNKYHFVAISKLMQIDFLTAFTSVHNSKQEEIITDMVFLAMKKGKNFGPHGKLY